MKTAEDWADDQTIVSSPRELRINAIRRIQVDALRYAAEICRKDDGLSILAADHIEKVAAELDIPHENPSPMG